MCIYNKCVNNILQYILLDWLVLHEIVNLDSATCNNLDRKILLNIYDEKGFCVNCRNYKEITQYHAQHWLVKKQIKFTNLILNSYSIDDFHNLHYEYTVDNINYIVIETLFYNIDIYTICNKLAKCHNVHVLIIIVS